MRNTPSSDKGRATWKNNLPGFIPQPMSRMGVSCDRFFRPFDSVEHGRVQAHDRAFLQTAVQGRFRMQINILARRCTRSAGIILLPTGKSQVAQFQAGSSPGQPSITCDGLRDNLCVQHRGLVSLPSWRSRTPFFVCESAARLIGFNLRVHSATACIASAIKRADTEKKGWYLELTISA
jgi:hypothetical protein